MEDYTLKEKLGEGAFSKVFKAERKQDSRFYALKKMEVEKLTEKSLKSCVNEVRILANISSPYVLQYIDSFFDQASKCFCTVTEYLEGGDLAHLIHSIRKSNCHMHEMMIWTYAGQLLQALIALHKAKVLHRDIKAANIFLSKDHLVAKLGDMNISTVSMDGKARTQTGTPYYASPQIWQQQVYDNKCDIWSLGCLLYELTSWKTPFQGNSTSELKTAVIRGTYKRIPSVYSDKLEELIRMCLVVDPKKRPTAQKLFEHPYIANLYEKSSQSTDNLMVSSQIFVIEKRDMPSVSQFKNINNYLPKSKFNKNNQEEFWKENNGTERNKKRINSVRQKPFTDGIGIKFIEQRSILIPSVNRQVKQK